MLMRFFRQWLLCLLVALLASSCSGLRSVPRDLAVKPRCRHSRVVNHDFYSLSFNKRTHNPNWVSWCLTADNVQNVVVERNREFYPDPKMGRRHRLSPNAYSGSDPKYDRGHMAPAADMKFSSVAQTECFYMSNMCPQIHSFNSGCWAELENACRKWAVEYGGLYVVCGPIFGSGGSEPMSVKVGRRKRMVQIPDAFYKVVLSADCSKAIGFIYKHNSDRQKMSQAACSVDSVEALTGYDFFSWLADDVEHSVESTFSLSDWKGVK